MIKYVVYLVCEFMHLLKLSLVTAVDIFEGHEPWCQQ